MAIKVRSKICDSVQQAGYYSILADETKDLSKKEQLAHFVDVQREKKASIAERFLTYVEATSLNAESLSKYILDTLESFNLDVNMIVSQGYDGASVMSGVNTGVQQRIREVAPKDIYVHCHAHCLNLVIVDCVKSNSYAYEFFALVETLYVFMSTSKAHSIFLEKQAVCNQGQQVRQLQRLSDTRWAYRYLALDAIASTFTSILETLEAITESTDKPKAVEATGILIQVKSFKFLVCLVIFRRILSITKSLSDHLQGEQIDFSLAADLVTSTSETLTELRSDDVWDHTYKYIKDVAALHDIEEVALPGIVHIEDKHHDI